MLSAVPAWNWPDGDHHRVEHVEGPGRVRLQLAHDLAPHLHRVERAGAGSTRGRPAPCTVTLKVSAAARIGPGLVTNQPFGHDRREDVHAVGGHDAAARGVEDALVDHDLRALVALLARLEHEDDVPGQVLAAFGQQAGRADQHGGVQVVAAGVHGAVDGRAVVDGDAFLDRQGVHVGAQQHARASVFPPRSTAVTEVRRLPVVTSRGSPPRAARTFSCVRGRSRPISGSRWMERRSSSSSS